MNKDQLYYTVTITAISTFIFVLLLSLANNATKAKVEENNRLIEAKAYLTAAGVTLTEEMDYEALFNTVYPDFNKEKSYQTANVSGKSIIVSPFQGNGLWGTIRGILGISTDLQRIIGIEIISHVETPGLGGRIDEPWFKNQFRGEFVGDGLIVRHGGSGGDKNPDNGIVDGITGASRTSDSIQKIINLQIKKLKSDMGGNNE
ncbi:MAG: FMN-binding protein [Spirochaetaceae bacterium]|jgi:Na+-transporting NADH:ubiquinone oxidoreductase subunit C|nr:FMN-binding protein [Spirochaetaceae bacterium]